MAQTIFHSSVEGAQHGAKSLADFLSYAKKAGAVGAEPSNYMLQDGKGFKSAKEIKDAFAKAKLKLDGVSAHCPFWVHTTAWTGSPTTNSFIPSYIANRSPMDIERWTEDYLRRLMDLCADLEVKTMPMSWGIAFGWEMTDRNPWGFWKGGDCDSLRQGVERFVNKTAKLRQHANSLGVYLCHEMQSASAAPCGEDFMLLVQACSGDKCLAVSSSCSHVSSSIDIGTQLQTVAGRVYACYVNNTTIRQHPLFSGLISDSRTRGSRAANPALQDLPELGYIDLLVQDGYPRRYCQITNQETAPLIFRSHVQPPLHLPWRTGCGSSSIAENEPADASRITNGTRHTLPFKRGQSPSNPTSRGGLFSSINHAYYNIRRLRACVRGPGSKKIRGKSISQNEVNAALMRAYGLLWIVLRRWFKRKTGCRCESICLCPEEVEDLVAQVREKLERHFNTAVQPFKNPSAAIFTVCRNVWCDRIRMLKRSPLGSSRTIPIENAPDATDYSPPRHQEVLQFAQEWMAANVAAEDQLIFAQWFFGDETLTSIARASHTNTAHVYRKKQSWNQELRRAFWNAQTLLHKIQT